MPDDRMTIAHEWFEQVWNQGQVEAIDRLFAEDGVAHGLVDAQGSELRGPAGYKPFFHTFREAFPDIRVIVEDAIVEGDKVAARCVVRGTHLGHNLGFAATGNRVEFTGMTFLRVRDGQIVEAWNNFDFATMNTQLSLRSGGDDTASPESSGSATGGKL
ncbi:MAG TPA: ester cyclase [Blastocatellia bacterium]